MGHRIDYPDDDVGRGLIESADGDYVRTTTNGYDAENHLTLVDSPEGVIQYAFDPATGRQTDTWTQPAGTGSSLLDREQATTWTHYDYDQIGRLLDVIAKRLNGQSVNLEMDDAYLATGQLAHQTTPNGVTSDWSFDQLGRLVQLAHKNSSETLATFRYTRDAVGQIKHTDESGSAVFGGSRSVDYQYDAINRLTEEVRHEGDNSTTITDYYFDLVGNRLRQVINAITTSYSYNNRDEKLTETAGSTTTKSYYDSNGSLKQTKQGDTVTAEYQYDLRNKMIQAAVNGVVVNYVYDQNGLQVRRTIGSDTDVYLQDKQNPTGYSQVLEHWRNGALYRTFVIGQSILAQVSGPTILTVGQTVAQSMQYLLADGHGDTRAILDASGQPITGQLIAYDTFGKVISGQTSILTPIQYAMQWIDDATGLSFNRARWYDLAGRWTQMDDPRYGRIGMPLTLHQRAYCLANPLNRLDPSGHSCIGEALTSMGIGGVVMALVVPTITGALTKRTGGSFLVGFLKGIPAGIAMGALVAESGGFFTPKFGFEFGMVTYSTLFGMAWDYVGKVSKTGGDPTASEVVDSVISNLSTVSISRAFKGGISAGSYDKDIPWLAAGASAGAQFLGKTPALVNSIVANFVNVSQGKPTDWPGTLNKFEGQIVDSILSGIQGYMLASDIAVPAVMESEAFKETFKQIAFGGWKLMLKYVTGN